MMNQTKKLISKDSSQKLKQILGIFLCLIYAVVYSGFVILSVYDIELMDKIVFLDLNLAVFYGLGIIIFALLLASVYSRLCVLIEKKTESSSNDTISNKSFD